jgi:hypothetical protein
MLSVSLPTTDRSAIPAVKIARFGLERYCALRSKLVNVPGGGGNRV